MLILTQKSRVLHDACVIGIKEITPHIRRVTVVGDGLKAMPIDRSAIWISLTQKCLSVRRPFPQAVQPKSAD